MSFKKLGHITDAAMIKQIKEYHGKLYDNTCAFENLVTMTNVP